MSGNHVAKATVGLTFTPRRRSRQLPTPTYTQATPATPVLVGKTEPAPPTSLSSQTLASSKAPSNAPVSEPAPKKPKWQEQSLSNLWVYYIKVRALYAAQKPQPDTPLARRYLAIREHLFLHYYPDVIRTAKSYKRRKMPQSSLTDIDDLEQAASVAMLLLLDKYDPNFGDGKVTFMGYANAKDKSRVQGSMIDTLRKLQEFPRPIADNRRKLRPEIRRLECELGYAPTLEEIITYLFDQHGRDFTEEVTDPLFNAGVFNQSQIANESDDSDSWEASILQLSEARPDSRIKKMANSDKEQKVLAVLKDAEVRAIIHSYYFCGANFDKVRREINKAFHGGEKVRSPAWIAAKHKEALAMIEAAFPNEKIFRELFLD